MIWPILLYHSSESGILWFATTLDFFCIFWNMHNLRAMACIILHVKIYRVCLAFPVLAHYSRTKSLQSPTQNLQLNGPAMSSWKKTFPSIIYGTWLASFLLFPFISWHKNSDLKLYELLPHGTQSCFQGNIFRGKKKWCYTQRINQSYKSEIRKNIKRIFRKNCQQLPGEDIKSDLFLSLDFVMFDN